MPFERMMFLKKLSIAVVFLICFVSIAAAIPVIYANIDDPNLVAYFNHDEAHIISHIWYYYSGSKLDCFQYENDYGVMLLYLAFFCRTFLERFVDFTPITFTIMLRWINLIFWIASIWMAWLVVKRHFGGNLMAMAAAALLASRPAFPLLCESSKPDSIVLFFMLFGLDRILCFVRSASALDINIAAACASIATLIKFGGVFLLLPMTAAIFFVSERSDRWNKLLFDRLRNGGVMLMAFLGAVLFAAPIVGVSFYVRQTSGLTWAQEFGIIDSLSKSNIALLSLAAGSLMLIASVILSFKNMISFKKKHAQGMFGRLLVCAFFAAMLFLAYSLIFGAGWIANPRHMVQTYATTVSEGFNGAGLASVEGRPSSFSSPMEVINKIGDFDPVFFVLFFASAASLLYSGRRGGAAGKLFYYNSLILVILVAPAILLMSFRVRMAHHHMLPFFMGSVILVSAEFKRRMTDPAVKPLTKRFAIIVSAVIIMALLYNNTSSSVGYFKYLYGRKNDIVFDVVRWWRVNCPAGKRIAADHPVRAYLPAEYSNAIRLKYAEDEVSQFRNIVKTFRPEYVYYQLPAGRDSLSFEKMLPGVKGEAAAIFDTKGKEGQRYRDVRFVVYKLTY